MADSTFHDGAEDPSATQVVSSSARQVERNVAAQKEDAAARLNQQVSVCVAVVVLGIGGLFAVQNSESFALPDRNKMWSDFWTKKLSDKSGFPEMKAPYDKELSNIKFEALTPMNNGFQFDPSSTSMGNTMSSHRSSRRGSN